MTGSPWEAKKTWSPTECLWLERIPKGGAGPAVEAWGTLTSSCTKGGGAVQLVN